ncbi:MAG: 2'-5' RNA ligase family protein [Lewinellaceae bacterium]|nr:2'-5' RNA ligase family protein [Lewinellaceae bacterium]
MNTKRLQLTLFVEAHNAVPLEKVRRAFNPAQYALIKSHVTLCREDEIAPLEQVKMNLVQLVFPKLSIDFGPPVRFDEGRGVLLPAFGPNEIFHQLRSHILQGIIRTPRRHEPHITLMHPRNSICTDVIFAQLQTTVFPSSMVFKRISLIEQEIGMPWSILETFDLGDD